jgi:hypothetical protein
MNARNHCVCKMLLLNAILITQQSFARTIQPQEVPTQPRPHMQTHKTTLINFKNDITKKMTEYRYMFFTYKPDVLTVTINGESVEPGQSKAIAITDNKVNIRYHFQFGSHRSGIRAAEYEINKTDKPQSLRFNWKNKNRISLSGATCLSPEDIVVPNQGN